ncbi:HEL183Wp [Eremothecium sinecaudum]|uniref:Protoheme IX farnesyltransferase, mitochondrial n=1 Tax=Eremothecium sinecaudum TaxID=45286 RepID=A0A0X8HTF9_9SACH|nr:HEL183Wp [Eremothecium sinecaudum]AMD21098.1 HEL183Wp [Eremothecium sinecaudum]
MPPLYYPRVSYSKNFTTRSIISLHDVKGFTSLKFQRQYSSKPQNNVTARLNSAPIEFTPNIPFQKLQWPIPGIQEVAKNAARSALRCNDTTTNIELPFEVKLVDSKSATKNRRRNNQDLAVNLKKTLIDPYIQLSKPRLTVLVMISAICSYALSPGLATISELLSLTVGTTLCSASANAINMGREPNFDRQMVRTQTRPVVRGLLTSLQAYKFSAITGTLGFSALYIGVNPVVALLGGFNILLYGWIYTSLKRKHIINTWVGAVVGAIPPLMGWAAASPLTHPGCWCLAGLLYSWQFPHFNTLSHNIRREYKNAGYVMAAWKNPKLNARVAMRHSLFMFPLCFGLSYFDITDWYFQIDSALINLWLSFWAFKFYFQQRFNYSKNIYGDKKEFNNGLAVANQYARKTFWVSVLHLPAILALAILHKKDRWNWLFNDDEKLHA